MPSTLKRFVRVSEIERVTGMDRVTIWRMRKRGAFPEPVQLTPRLVAWPTDVVEGWLASRAAAMLADAAAK